MQGHSIHCRGIEMTFLNLSHYFLDAIIIQNLICQLFKIRYNYWVNVMSSK